MIVYKSSSLHDGFYKSNMELAANFQRACIVAAAQTGDAAFSEKAGLGVRDIIYTRDKHGTEVMTTQRLVGAANNRQRYSVIVRRVPGKPVVIQMGYANSMQQLVTGNGTKGLWPITKSGLKRPEHAAAQHKSLLTPSVVA